MYYLQSRYYDPEVCRFINADDYVSTGQDFIGCNMFAYCNNNPTNCYDSAGTLPCQNTMRMTCDGGHNRAFYEMRILEVIENLTPDEQYFLDPAVTGTISTTGISNSAATSASLSHGVLGNDKFKMTVDFFCADVCIEAGAKGIDFTKGFYLAKVSFALKLTPESPQDTNAPEIWLEVGGSLGWGNNTRVNENEFSIGGAKFVGGSISIGTGADKTYYLREILNSMNGG